jgi:hypothetical protein
MKKYIVYKESTGEILRTGSCPDDMLSMQAGAGEIAIEGIAIDTTQYIDIATQLVVDKILIPCSINKTTMAADGVDSATISNLPNPSLIHIKDEGRWEITDGEFQFTVDTPGVYRITIISPIYLNVEYNVNAN